ncbi:hypothetical protein V6N13_037091 [Hibiscus sabdariffa]
MASPLPRWCVEEHAGRTSRRNATWLILPVVICLSQRLSHACGSADVAFRTPPAPYEKSKSLGSGGSMVASASHQLALTTSLPFVHTARRSYRLNGPVKCSDRGDVAERPVNVLSNINGRGCGRFIAPRPLPVPVTQEPVSPWQNEQPPA